MNKVEIHPKILEKLKCTKCKEYLNYLPICMIQNGNSICGRCISKSDSQSLRNTAYEDVAKMLLFPCRYEKDGCPKKLTLTEVKSHEEYCEYQIVICPAMPIAICKWKGFNSQLLQHFREKHIDLIVDHPYEFNHDVTINSEKNILTQVFGFLFLIQIKCNLFSGQIYHSVQLINTKKLASQFKYYLQMTKNDMKFSGKKILVEQLPKLLQNTKSSIEYEIQALDSIFDGFEDLLFCLTIIRHEHICISCEEIITETSTNITIDCATYCDKCNPKAIDKGIIPCISHMDGCTYKGNDNNMMKHTQWDCKYGINKCQFCDKIFKSNTRIDHLLHICDKITVFNSKIQTNECVIDEKPIIFNINIYSKHFYCILSKKRSTLSMTVVTVYPKEELSNFCIEVTINHRSFPVYKNQKMKMNDEANYDWKLSLDVGSLPCNVKFIIKQNIK